MFRVWEISPSKPGLETLLNFLVVLLSPSKDVPEYYLKLELDDSFPHSL